MAGMQFEYDEKGGTFYYFLLSFMALVLLPAQYYCWPGGAAREDPEKEKKKCHCPQCEVKDRFLKARAPHINLRRWSIRLALIIGWVLFALVAYQASQVELDLKEWDPYQELGLDHGATVKEVKKKYRELSKTHHPDRGGDETQFQRIAKAHMALTDEESMKNWEMYGNPDGPGATRFGIALPKWIVESQNSIWVLAVYGLVFMVALPTAVGTWWYRSIKFNSESILMDTHGMYMNLFHRTPNMIVKRVIMILGSSSEFFKRHNSEVTERPSDNVELPRLMRDLIPGRLVKSKRYPFCYPFSMKAQCLLHSHFQRMELPANSLEVDRQYILPKSPYLINEMIKVVAQLIILARQGRCHMPRLETVENCMRTSQMVVQGLWETSSPLMQLPHITPDMLRHFVTKKRSIRTIREFAALKEDARRPLLRSLAECEYKDVLSVCMEMPYIEMEVKSEVMDDEDSSVAAGDIVTVFVKLIRRSMEEKYRMSMDSGDEEEEERIEAEQIDDDVEDIGATGEVTALKDAPDAANKPKAWEKQKKAKKGKGGKPKKQAFAKKAPPSKKPTPKEVAVEKKEDTPGSVSNGGVSKRKARRYDDDDGSDSSDCSAPESDVEDKDDSRVCESKESGKDADTETENEDGGDAATSANVNDDEDEWLRFQEEQRKETMLDAKSKETHEVHCPHFPSKKYEWWWLYVADRKYHTLITAPLQVCSLKTEAEFQLKFCAPPQPGSYLYTVMLKSDSYLDQDLKHDIKVEVNKAKIVEDHPQWEFPEDEDEKADDEGSETDMSTDYAESDED